MINTHIKKKFFLTVQSPLKNIKEMMDLEIHHLATIFEIWLKQESLINANLVCMNLMNNRVST